ncbi:MAG TPA: hypothetical protein VF556_15470 [Pyrinomonadaceae bacterium]|jgi:hypothetical protein
MSHKITVFLISAIFVLNVLGCSFKISGGNNQTGSAANETAAEGNSNGDSRVERGETNVSSPQKPTTGTYRYKSGNYNNAIGVEDLGKNRYRISIAANYEYKVDGEWMANSGGTGGEVTLEGDTAVLVPADFPDCRITLKFSGNKITVKQKGTDFECGFGGKASAEGTYVKTSDKLDYNEMIDDVPQAAPATDQANGEERVRFKPGASSAIVNGKISGGGRKTYVLGARAGQTMTIKVIDGGKNNDVVFYIVAPDGTHPMGDEEGEGYDSGWSGALQKNGDYKIVVSTIESENTPFKIQIAVR